MYRFLEADDRKSSLGTNLMFTPYCVDGLPPMPVGRLIVSPNANVPSLSSPRTLNVLMIGRVRYVSLKYGFDGEKNASSNSTSYPPLL